VCQVVAFVANTWPGAPIIFFGGEPTTRDDLPSIIKACVEHKVKYAIISNSVRVLKDREYAAKLVEAGLSNWSTSFDGAVKELVTDTSVLRKSINGIDALRMFRDKYGIRDLVTCITVTKKNIDALSAIIQQLTSEGIWSICTPLQCPLPILQYDYSAGDMAELPSQEQVESSAKSLSFMAKSGRFLMHNEPEWFDLWPKYFRNQAWKCRDKGNLTIDADGSLRLCVDIALPFAMGISDLQMSYNVKRYAEALGKEPPCSGCFWDPAFESLQRSTREGLTQEEGRKSFRHELTNEQIGQLLPEAQRWFMKTK
jgi:MoaA/NifB/PqqE/SkfB family radical SAM enzyme